MATFLTKDSRVLVQSITGSEDGGSMPELP